MYRDEVTKEIVVEKIDNKDILSRTIHLILDKLIQLVYTCYYIVYRDELTKKITIKKKINKEELRDLILNGITTEEFNTKYDYSHITYRSLIHLMQSICIVCSKDVHH